MQEKVRAKRRVSIWARLLVQVAKWVSSKECTSENVLRGNACEKDKKQARKGSEDCHVMLQSDPREGEEARERVAKGSSRQSQPPDRSFGIPTVQNRLSKMWP